MCVQNDRDVFKTKTLYIFQIAFSRHTFCFYPEKSSILGWYFVLWHKKRFSSKVTFTLLSLKFADRNPERSSLYYFTKLKIKHVEVFLKVVLSEKEGVRSIHNLKVLLWLVRACLSSLFRVFPFPPSTAKLVGTGT
jgi:hypothetical protein